MRQVQTMITALTVVCIASVCLAGLVTFMLWREAGRVLDRMHVRDGMRSEGSVAKLSAAETTMAAALFGQTPGRPGAMAAQNLTTMAFVDGSKPLTQQDQVTRRMAAAQLKHEFSDAALVHEYLETAYYGAGEYGMIRAARSMFGKEPADLTDEEVYTLAAILQAPALRSNPERLAQRVDALKQKVK